MFAVRANLFCVLWVLAAKSFPSSFLPRVAGETFYETCQELFKKIFHAA